MSTIKKDKAKEAKTFRKPDSSFERITPDKAMQMLKQNSKNRPINETHLQSLCSELEKGNFHVTGESIKIAKNGDLLDGQHRLMAVVKTKKPIEIFVIRGLEEESFKYMDSGRTRKAGDVVGIAKIKNPHKIAAVSKFVIQFQSGHWGAVASYDKRVNKKRTLTNAEILDFAQKNITSLEESFKYGHNKDNKLLSGNTLTSFHYIFKKHDEEAANNFCERLADGDGLSKSNIIFMLRQKLLNDLRSSRKMSTLEKYALICKSWNVYRGKSKMPSTILKWDANREPFPKPL